MNTHRSIRPPGTSHLFPAFLNRTALGIIMMCMAVSAWCAESADSSSVSPITTQIWQEAVVSVTDLDRTARFFREIGGYEVKWQGAVDASAALNTIENRGASVETPLHRTHVAPYGEMGLFSVKAPDGAIVQFYQLGSE